MNKKTVLITGVAGLIGSHFAKYLLDKKYNVIGIDNLSGGYKDFVDKRMLAKKHFYKIDLLNTRSLEDVFKKHKIDFVYHFAAYAAEGLSPFIRNFNYTNNLLCSINVINCCIKYSVKKLIFTSSMATYGTGKPPFRESQKPEPEDPYGIAKYAVEMDIARANAQFGLKYNIVRPHNVIGINQNIWDKYRNVIGIWIRESIEGRTINVFGDGKQKRAFSDIKYYMEPLRKLITHKDCGIFNIGADKEHQLIDVAKTVQKVAKEFNLNPEIKHLQARHEVKVAYSNHDKAKRLLGFKDGTDIESTIREMFAWAIKQPPRKIKLMKYEIEKDIYSFWK